MTKENAAANHPVKHRRKGTPEYKVWAGIVQRCTNPKRHNYPRYGGRGINICERWRDFRNFLADVGERPSVAHQLDRIDNSKGYEPGNCRWVTNQTNSNNARHNKHITFNGETRTVAEWARHLGINPSTLYTRLRKMTSDEALGTPVRK